jgi:putative peptidoglycan lipid II flippase
LLGLPFAAIDLLLVFAFYARQDTVTPALVGIVTLGAYMITAIVLLPHIGFLSLMVADSVKHALHSMISGWILWRRVGGLRDHSLFSTILHATFAATIMGIGAYGALLALEHLISSGTIFGELIHVVGAGMTGAVIYIMLGNLLGLRELRWMTIFVQQRLRRA